jgi:hypothetical protein
MPGHCQFFCRLTAVPKPWATLDDRAIICRTPHKAAPRNSETMSSTYFFVFSNLGMDLRPAYSMQKQLWFKMGWKICALCAE